jgi:DNA-binding CsgD family transcriptional regulator
LFAEAAERAREIGRQWAPYGLDSAVFGTIATHVGGDWDLAAEMADMTGEAPPEIAAAIFAAIGLVVAADRGEVAALETMPAIRATWSLDGLIAITSGAAAIELYAQAGDLDAAIAVHDDTVAHVISLWQRSSFHAQVRLAALLVGQLATAAATATATTRAALVARGDALTDGALQIAAEDRFGGPEGVAWAERARAERARLHWLAGIDPLPEPDLVELWRRASEAFETFGHVYETARSQARLAAVLYAAGDTVEAAAQAGLARGTATKLGARPLLAELRGLTGEAGDTRVAASRDTDALTPREHDVLVQVATGRSNREIAQQLFISAKTVSVHISNLMAKLDAASRTEAVAVARRKGLLD